ncbi:MAG: NfeD family protein [Planctomycetaceae bacterium]
MAGDRPLLLLQIEPGSADFKSAAAIAEFLSSAAMRGVHTLAWVPSGATGPRALIALACREIVLHPDAELGDLGEGAALTSTQRQQVDRIIARGANPRATGALAAAMSDPAVALVALTFTQGAADVEPISADAASTRIVTADEVGLLRDAGLAIQDVRVFKAAGVPTRISGRQAEAAGILVAGSSVDLASLTTKWGIDEDELDLRSAKHSSQRPALIKVEGEIEPLQTAYLIRQIERAVEQRADVVIFEIDSPGGYLQDSLELAFAIHDLRDHGIRTVAYIPRDAVSGAALISLGCDEIYLQPRGKIGDAGPIFQTDDGSVHRAPEKILSYLREVVRELAELKGRPPAVLMAMVDRQLEIYRVTHRDSGKVWYLADSEIDNANGEWIKGPVVEESPNELLLFVRGERAHELKIAEPPVRDFDELRERLGIAPEVQLVPAERTWVDNTVHILNTDFMTGLLFFFGLIFLFVEMHFVSGLFGILSALCFGVFFWSKFLGGTADWLEVMLFLIGIACLMIELFVIPGFGVFGVAGGLLLLASLVMAGLTLNSIDQAATSQQTWGAIQSLGLAVVGVIGAAAVLSHFMPRIPLLNAMILTPPTLVTAVPSGTVTGQGSEGELVGQRGQSITMLRPSGKVRLGGRIVDAVSRGNFVEADTEVEVIEARGKRIVVQAVGSVADDDAAETA